MIYFIQCKHGGPIKIGFANDVQARLKDIQSVNPYRLQVLGTLNGDFQLELRLHKRFDKYRLHNEWFEDGPELLEFIDHLHEFDYKKLLSETLESKFQRQQRMFDYRGEINRLADTAIVEEWSDEHLHDIVFQSLTNKLMEFGHSEWSAKRLAKRYASYSVLHRSVERKRWDAMKHQVRLFPIDSQ